MTSQFIDGNEAVVRGALQAGCRFFAGYPITPATSIYQQMLHHLPPMGGICLQGEDEIASIGFCLGAAMAGWKAMTATSGPGISLYSEQISFAIGSEIPLVIVDVQRLGPSTGSATKGADGDIQFLRWGNSGGLPVVVLAPTGAADSFLLTVHAFDIAERYRCPVFIASNKEIGQTRETVDLYSLQLPEELSDPAVAAKTHGDGRRLPPLAAIGGSILSRQTSSTHGDDGYITTDPTIIDRRIQNLAAKFTEQGPAPVFELDSPTGHEPVLLIAYGVTARAAREAVQEMRRQNEAVALLVLKTLFPVPGQLLRDQIKKRRRVVVVEMNTGQYVREVERLAGEVTVEFYGRMNGELISPGEIREWVRQ